MDSMPHNTLQNDKTGFALWYVLLQWFDSSVLLIVLLCVQHWCTVSFVTSGTHINFPFQLWAFLQSKGAQTSSITSKLLNTPCTDALWGCLAKCSPLYTTPYMMVAREATTNITAKLLHYWWCIYLINLSHVLWTHVYMVQTVNSAFHSTLIYLNETFFARNKSETFPIEARLNLKCVALSPDGLTAILIDHGMIACYTILIFNFLCSCKPIVLFPSFFHLFSSYFFICFSWEINITNKQIWLTALILMDVVILWID